MVKRNHFAFFALLSFINVLFASFYCPYFGIRYGDYTMYYIGGAFGFLSILLLIIGAFVLFIKEKALVLHIGVVLSVATSLYNLVLFCSIYEYMLCGMAFAIYIFYAYFMGFSKFNAQLPSNKKSFLLFTLTLAICSLCSRLQNYWYSGVVSSFNFLIGYWQLPIMTLWIISLFLGNRKFFGWYCDGVAGLAGVLCIAKNLSQIGEYVDLILLMTARIIIVVTVLSLYFILRYKFKNLFSETPVAVQANEEKSSDDITAKYKKVAELYELLENGILTEAEYESEKAKIFEKITVEEDSNVF